MNYMEIYNQWLESDYFDAETKQELENIKGNEKEIEDRFYTDLEFGTAGLRGIIAAGTNRINIYTVRRATFGLANYIMKNTTEEEKNRGVVIAHDNRNMSREFCLEAANTLAACGIKAYIFDSLRTTPELSFAVRKLHTIAGIVITASHNPPEYAISATEKGLPLEEYAQTLANFNKPTREMERLILSGKAAIDNNEINRYCFRNVTLKSDHNGNIKPNKQVDKKKIDGTISMIQALGMYLQVPHYTNQIFTF